MEFGDPRGTLHGPCTTFRCRILSKVKPRSTHFNRREKRWVCVWCAQQENGKELGLKIARDKLSCISGQQYVYEELLK